ncbi:hypothetical protein NEMBOFW57_007024 [Staphylotrichum longicolle]|uniref:Uncharacterized protein n=1 Tax=Staphylotrichum longicolle TaxID=669026 RepID=A0AAD4EXK6_9PEZI|nr:hypothetical protein NEMBOFW57_007024 [Staphylotrichum longicolle]
MEPATSPKRVLLLTNSEHGQANVFLATSYAFLTLEDEDVEVHFASFTPIKSLVSLTSDHARQDRPGARPIIFHAIDGLDMVSAWTRPEIVAEQASLQHCSPIPLVDAIRRTLVLLKVTLPWTGPEFVQIMRYITSIVSDVQPHTIAVDPAFSPALTALRHINAKFIVLSPNTIKDFAMPLQPNGEALWKYPCIPSPRHPLPLPLPLLSTPHNILLILLSLLVAALDPTRRALTAHLARHVPGARLTTLADLSLHAASLGTRFLVANLPEIEFPLKVVPGHIVPCGPMLRPARPVAEVDPQLDKWLRAGPQPGGGVVYINLGTHVFFDEGMVEEMAGAVRVLLDGARERGVEGVRVLWKIPRRSGEEKLDGTGEVVESVLGEEVEKGVVKVVEWVDAEPSAVLETGMVVCAVHHGGANSFLESVW